MTYIDARQYVTNPAGNKPQDPAAVIGIAVHHSVSGQTFTEASSQAEEIGHIRIIDNYHVGLDYGGFAYHMAAFPSGRLYLCGTGQRAHVAKRNHQLRGIVAIGDFTSKAPGPKQMAAIIEGIRYQFTDLGRDVMVAGHTEWALPGEGTACPGQIVGTHWGDLLNTQEAPAMARFELGPDQYIEGDGTTIKFVNKGIPVLRLGSEDGRFPGQVAKNFGGKWVYLRNDGQPGNMALGEAWFSLEPGD